MTREVEAFVANILDAYRVTLTAGTDHGVSVDDAVTLWRVVTVTHPKTGETLGDVRVDNLRMRVSEVQEKLSVAAVPREASSFFTSFSVSLPRKRITAGSADDPEDAVVVRVGDTATVYTTDDASSE